MERYFEMKATEAGKVEDFLRKQMGLTRKQISQAKFRVDGICKNGKQCRVTEKVTCGDMIRVCIESKEIKTCLENYSGEQPNLFQNNSGKHTEVSISILYEDRDLLVINKPAGMVTHPSGSHYQDSLSNQIAEYFRSKGEETRIRSVGRLDKETSGILLFARNQVAAARLQKQREEGKMQKTYLAVVRGEFTGRTAETQKIAIPLAPDPYNPVKMVLSPEGTLPGSKNAVTCYEVVKKYGDASLIQLHLETGRTHQIRVHMAGIGHPLLGDALYNSAGEKSTQNKVKNCFTRAALHAWKLTFYHPFTDAKITLEAPLPDDFESFLKENKEEKQAFQIMSNN